MAWKYFSYESDLMLACPCCGKRRMNYVFMLKMDKIREECGFPLIVTSGYRCPEYNNRISSTGYIGPHTTGCAIDVKTSARQRSIFMKIARKYGLTRFGVGKGFTHGDDLTEKDGFDKDVTWGY